MKQQCINYSQCWEDSDVLLKALSLKSGDTVLSITSGGDNSLAILSGPIKKLTVVDMHSCQNYLMELKLIAARKLSYEEFLAFVGVTPASNRIYIFRRLRKSISSEAFDWWSNNEHLIEMGIIHCGRFEKYLTLFSKYILPFIHSKKVIVNFLAAKSVNEQYRFYLKSWNSFRWKTYFRIASSKFLLRKFARQDGMFGSIKVENIAKVYLLRLEKKLKTKLISSNYFIYYCLTGGFGTDLPFYLREQNVAKYIRKRKVVYISSTLLQYLQKVPSNTFSKYNLSDIFEALPEDKVAPTWREIVRTAKKNATVVYWDNLRKSEPPADVQDYKSFSKELYIMERAFFYGGVHVCEILK
ncbi:MAG: DUF3419 family protein [Candidatus Levybacteria bacterium]|nr:DUF3419 family protein [Candidatus Levybacteria bacterium]